MSFSPVDQVIFNQLGIRLRPLVLLVARRREIETLGLAETEGNWLSIDATRQLLCLIRNCVSKVVSSYRSLVLVHCPWLYSQNEAASRFLINMFLLRLASVMRNEEAEVNIIPEFPIPKNTFQGHSFGGVVDFLVTQAHSEYTGAPTQQINLTTWLKISS